MITCFLLNDECAKIASNRHVRVIKTPYTPLLYSKLSVHIANHPFSLFTLSVAIATVSVDEIELGVYVTNHHFDLLTLSVATATVSVDTKEHAACIANHHFHFVYTKRCYYNRECRHYIELGVYVANHHFDLLTQSVATATVSVDTIEHAVCISNHHFLFVYTKRCYYNRECRHYIELGVHIAYNHLACLY